MKCESLISRSARSLLRILLVLGLTAGILSPVATARPAYAAASISSAVFSGGAGTAVNNNTLYARNGGSLSLTVITNKDVRCVEISGAHSARQTSSSEKENWTFAFTAGLGNGAQTVDVTATASFNANNCTGQKHTVTASYVLDNTGPSVTAEVAPASNLAGWNNSNVSITWSATDTGAGVASGPTPATDSVNANIAGVTKTSTASDRLGNTGSGSVTVRLDKQAPSISGSRAPAANLHGWNNSDVTVSFTCSDGLSGIKSCTGSTTLSGEGANQVVSGTAIDIADNSASTTVSGIQIDKTAPSLSGAPLTAPNGNNWYNSDVQIGWTCSDDLSGIDGSCPSNSTITGEGEALTVSASVNDKAGNSASATSSPAVRIDRTAPNTIATAPAAWNNVDVTVNLNAFDSLSGVQTTYHRLNGNSQQSGSSVSINAEGIHTLEFWSVDNAGNIEVSKTVQVKIDKTSPTISYNQSPAMNENGWNNAHVTVTFICNDSLSGIASCTEPQEVTTEGQNQSVTGTAEDNAGNTATAPATVSIDMTPPSISAAPDRAANSHGWYNDDVTVRFTCDDELSGISACSTPQILGEGANQSTSGTAADAAGNSASTELTGINIDKTAPSLSGAAIAPPNGNGWYNNDVQIAWTCNDDLSGIDGACPTNSTVTGEGNNLSASASINDKAGNTANTTVDGIQIDRTAPTTNIDVPDPLASGWYAGAVEVTLTGLDYVSGIDKTYYRVDDGTTQEYSGPFNYDQGGTHTITFWSVDKAGNHEDANAPGHSITIQIDNIVPTIVGSRSPMANTRGWNNGPVTVSFACEDWESGIATCTGSVALESDGAGQSVTGSAVDYAGNTAAATVDNINIDTTKPTASAMMSHAPNNYGWHNTDVTVSFTGTDDLSGIESCSANVVLGHGAAQSASGACTDNAGNVSAAVANISIDKNKPSVTLNSPSSYYINDRSSWPTCSAIDDLSGFADNQLLNAQSLDTASVTKVTYLHLPFVASTQHAGGNFSPQPVSNKGKSIAGTALLEGSYCTMSGFDTSSLGTRTVTATATDMAGNTATTSATYKVIYNARGFFSPVDNVSSGIYNKAKAGSAIPIKFSLGGNYGLDIFSSGFPKAVTVTCNSGAPSEEVAAITAGGSTLSYDASTDQYTYVWKTDKSWGNSCRQFQMKLKDGESITANFNLTK